MPSFVRIRGQVHGPFDDAQIENMIVRRQLNPRSDISTDSISWCKIGTHPNHAKTFESLTVMARSTEQEKVENEGDVNYSSGWYYQAQDGSAAGPLNESAVSNLSRLGMITTRTQVWHESWDSWRQAGNSDEFLRRFAPQPVIQSARRVRARSTPASKTLLMVTAFIAAVIMFAGVIALMMSKSDASVP